MCKEVGGEGTEIHSPSTDLTPETPWDTNVLDPWVRVVVTDRMVLSLRSQWGGSHDDTPTWVFEEEIEVHVLSLFTKIKISVNDTWSEGSVVIMGLNVSVFVSEDALSVLNPFRTYTPLLLGHLSPLLTLSPVNDPVTRGRHDRTSSIDVYLGRRTRVSCRTVPVSKESPPFDSDPNKINSLGLLLRHYAGVGTRRRRTFVRGY